MLCVCVGVGIIELMAWWSFVVELIVWIRECFINQFNVVWPHLKLPICKMVDAHKQSVLMRHFCARDSQRFY